MKDLLKSLVDEADKWVGVREKGFNKGPEVEAFQKAVDGKASGEAWCMAFVQFCIEEIEKRFGVKSEVFKSEHCMTVWNKSPKHLRLEYPEEGAIVIWQHYTKFGKSTGSGHTGIIRNVVGKDFKTFETIEGNTGPGFNPGEIVREGDGVYNRIRRSTRVGTMRVMGYLRPFPIDAE